METKTGQPDRLLTMELRGPDGKLKDLRIVGATKTKTMKKEKKRIKKELGVTFWKDLRFFWNSVSGTFVREFKKLLKGRK